MLKPYPILVPRHDGEQSSPVEATPADDASGASDAVARSEARHAATDEDWESSHDINTTPALSSVLQLLGGAGNETSNTLAGPEQQPLSGNDGNDTVLVRAAAELLGGGESTILPPAAGGNTGHEGEGGAP
jgi:hypothetical protein